MSRRHAATIAALVGRSKNELLRVPGAAILSGSDLTPNPLVWKFRTRTRSW